jgi:hypothetical protein
MFLEVHRRRRIWLLGPLALAAAAVGVHSSSAAPTRATTPAATIDATYSCRAPGQHLVDLYASPTLPPLNNRAQPGVLVVTTGAKTVTHGSTVTVVSQVGLSAKRNSLKVDKSSCRRVKKRVPLKPKGLPTPPSTATPALFGHIHEQCGTTTRVLVHLRFVTTAGAPTHALLAIRSDGAKSRTLAFFKWSPQKVTAYARSGCVSSG